MSFTYEFPKEDDLLYTLSSVLMEHDDDDSANLAWLLLFVEIEFSSFGQYSFRRWDEYLAYMHLHAPMRLVKFFSDTLKTMLLDLVRELIPPNCGYWIESIEVHPRLEKAYNDWRDDHLKMIVGEGLNNQASFQSSSHPMCEYKGIRFRSKSERALAAHFEDSGVLFFPLPLAVCGAQRKEPDFLVCQCGRWAILEVVTDHTHPSVEKEADRTNWFQNHGVTIRQYPAKECLRNSSEVVADFLSWMERNLA